MSAPTLRRVAGPLARGLRAAAARRPSAGIVPQGRCARALATAAPPPRDAMPLRKHLKDEAKRHKAEARGHGGRTPRTAARDDWELTVGIEIHAELNTARKLFSTAAADGAEGGANRRVALFDAAMPGAQPRFQAATLLPAVRAAVALGCAVQRESGWDRKHYFHWDQPHGYQITQYYHPFATDGHLSLTAADGVPPEDLHGAAAVRIGIKQIQMEQDTAKTVHVADGVYHVDVNRAGLPLIEIITLPQIHSPQTAAAVVRKVQGVLKAVDACVTGMELGGLRADVNVSVRRRGTAGAGGSNYGGVTGLGQRTEIKNLSSFKAVEDAVVAERDRQIAVLAAGGTVEGETRGWTLGATATTRLRGKEGEVDYRYMPDPDLPPLRIGADLVDHLCATLPPLPDATVARLQDAYGLSPKDAKTLVELDDGDRIDFLEDTVARMCVQSDPGEARQEKAGRLVGNWILHELGGLLTASASSWEQLAVTTEELASILVHLQTKQITSRAAKQLLATLFEWAPGGPAAPGSSRPSVETLIDAGNLRLRPLSEEQYEVLAKSIVDENPQMATAVREKGQKGKAMWFVGQMVRRGDEGTVEPEKARQVVQRLLAS